MTRNALRLAVTGAALIAPLIFAGAPAQAQTPAPTPSACKLQAAGELHVLLDGNRPVIPAEVNGHKVAFLIDTGSGNNMLLRAEAERIGAKGVEMRGVEMTGVGGRSNVNSTVIQDLKLDTLAMQNVTMMVAGESQRIAAKVGDREVVGVLGAILFQRFDVEFDLADGVIRFFKSEGCGNNPLAYWGGAYSTATMRGQPNDYPEFEVGVVLNGRAMEAVLDTGASTSVVTTDAAGRANVRPGQPGVREVQSGGGFGKERVKTWVGTFDSFSIGEETIKNVKLPIADLFGADAEVPTGSRVAQRPEDTPSMLLGADFFRSHRVLIANSQHRVYFSYKGGAVFQADRQPTPRPAEAKPTTDARPAG